MSYIISQAFDCGAENGNLREPPRLSLDLCVGECGGVGLDIGKDGSHDVCVSLAHRLHEEVVVADGHVLVDGDVVEELTEGGHVEKLGLA